MLACASKAERSALVMVAMKSSRGGCMKKTQSPTHRSVHPGRWHARQWQIMLYRTDSHRDGRRHNRRIDGIASIFGRAC